HEGEIPCHLRAVEGHGEEEAQRGNRAVDARRTHAGLRLMQLKTAKILGRGRIRRAPEEGCERPDVPDIVVARLLDEVAHAHAFDHGPAQRADGLLTHRGRSGLEGRFVDPLILKTGRPARPPITWSLHRAATRSALARSALPRKWVRSLTLNRHKQK